MGCVLKMSFYLRILIPFLLFVTQLWAEKNSIPILVSHNHTNYIYILSQIRSTFPHKTNPNFMDVILSTENDTKEFIEITKNNKPPLIIALGQTALKFSLQHFQDTPILFTLVHAPKSMDLLQTKSCGITIDIPIKEYFSTMKEIKPNAKKVLSFYSNGESEFLVKEGDYAQLGFDLTYIRIPLDIDGNIKSQLDKLKFTPDAILLFPDPIYTKENFMELSNFVSNKSIILMTTYSGLSDLGATFSISPLNFELSKMIVLTAKNILEKKIDCEDGRLQLLQNYDIQFNEEYSRKSKISIPETLLKKSRLSFLLKAGIKLYDTDRFISAKNVFDQVLKEDKSNAVAINYSNLISYKLTGEETSKYLLLAKKELEFKKYSSGREYFKKVLKLNPEHIEARLGIKESLSLESEDIRVRAKSLYANGKLIDSIKGYINAIQISDENSVAKKELSEIRLQSVTKVDDYIKSGITDYNVRNYKTAIRYFEEALLIQPENKKAQEYLSLSQKKNSAVASIKDCFNNKEKSCEILWK